MASYIARRKFLATLGGAATAWPLGAGAQQREKMRRIGVLMNLAADDPQSPVRIAAFLQGLQESGWTDGRNLRIDYRWGAADLDRYRRYAAELVALVPDVILAGGGSVVGPLLQVARNVCSRRFSRRTHVQPGHGPPLLRLPAFVRGRAAVNRS